MTDKQGLWNNPAFRHLYAAHATSLLGSGLGGVALGLLAYELVGASAPMVLGVALTIRIVVIVLLSPWAGLVAARFGSKPTLIACDVLRAVGGLAYPLAGWTVSQRGFTAAALSFGSALLIVSLPLWSYQIWMWAIHRSMPDANHEHNSSCIPALDEPHQHGSVEHRHFHLHL